MSYTKINWQNLPSTTTPLNATNLNHMDDGIAEAVNNRLPLSGGTITGATNFNSAVSFKDGIELYSTSPNPSPLIDFHYDNSSSDYTSRIIEPASGKLQMICTTGFEVSCGLDKVTINNQRIDKLLVKNGNLANVVTLSWATTHLKLTIDSTDIGYFAMEDSSDERLKKDIQPIDENVIEAIGEIELKQFKLKRNNPNNKVSFGVIAQDLIAAFEKYNLDIEDYSLIDTIIYEDGIKYYTVDYNQFNTLRLAYLEKSLDN